MLMACLRCSAADIPTKRVRASGNPGGKGHLAVKAYFIDPAPMGRELIQDHYGRRMFIRSLVTDNRILLSRDPEYMDRLKRVGSPELVRMWLEGDWNVTAGAYFPEFGDRHIKKPFPIPPHWTRVRAYDHGSAKPFNVSWWAIASDGGPDWLRPGDAVCYRQWYGASGPNVGLKLTIEQIAQGIRERSYGEDYAYSVADPSIFIEDGGPSKGETFQRCGVTFTRGDNSRLAGWEQFRSRLVGYDGKPAAYWLETCKDAIRTIPAMQHDEKRPEELDSELEDHAVDADRYFFMSRPFHTPTIIRKQRPINDISLNDLWKDQEEHKREII